MTKKNKIVEKNDLIDLTTYKKNRSQLRKNLIQFSKLTIKLSA